MRTIFFSGSILCCLWQRRDQSRKRSVFAGTSYGVMFLYFITEAAEIERFLHCGKNPTRSFRMSWNTATLWMIKYHCCHTWVGLRVGRALEELLQHDKINMNYCIDSVEIDHKGTVNHLLKRWSHISAEQSKDVCNCTMIRYGYGVIMFFFFCLHLF